MKVLALVVIASAPGVLCSLPLIWVPIWIGVVIVAGAFFVLSE